MPPLIGTVFSGYIFLSSNSKGGILRPTRKWHRELGANFFSIDDSHISPVTFYSISSLAARE